MSDTERTRHLTVPMLEALHACCKSWPKTVNLRQTNTADALRRMGFIHLAYNHPTDQRRRLYVATQRGRTAYRITKRLATGAA